VEAELSVSGMSSLEWDYAMASIVGGDIRLVGLPSTSLFRFLVEEVLVIGVATDRRRGSTKPERTNAAEILMWEIDSHHIIIGAKIKSSNT